MIGTLRDRRPIGGLRRGGIFGFRAASNPATGNSASYASKSGTTAAHEHSGPFTVACWCRIHKPAVVSSHSKHLFSHGGTDANAGQWCLIYDHSTTTGIPTFRFRIKTDDGDPGPPNHPTVQAVGSVSDYALGATTLAANLGSTDSDLTAIFSALPPNLPDTGYVAFVTGSAVEVCRYTGIDYSTSSLSLDPAAAPSSNRAYSGTRAAHSIGDSVRFFDTMRAFFVAGVFDGSAAKLYVNGNLRATTSAITQPLLAYTTHGCGIGVKAAGSGNGCDADIAECSYWGRALSAIDIANLMMFGPMLGDPTLKAYYPCDDGGGTIRDYSRFGVDLTVTGQPMLQVQLDGYK